MPVQRRDPILDIIRIQFSIAAQFSQLGPYCVKSTLKTHLQCLDFLFCSSPMSIHICSLFPLLVTSPSFYLHQHWHVIQSLDECICAKEYHECKPEAVPWLVNSITDRTLRNASSYKESESGRITPKRSILKHLPDKKC